MAAPVPPTSVRGVYYWCSTVVLFFSAMPAAKECQQLVRAGAAAGEDRNIVCIRHGVVVEAYKGLADEVAPALLPCRSAALTTWFPYVG